MHRTALLLLLISLVILIVVGEEEQEEKVDRGLRTIREASPRRRSKGQNGRKRQLTKGRGEKGGKGKKKGSGKNRKSKVKTFKAGTVRATTCTTNSTCLDNAVSYLRLMKDTVGNYFKQEKRISAANKTGGGKSGKKGLFAPTLRRIVKAGGGNKSDLQCNGVSNSTGANQLTNLTQTLLKCEQTINASCNTANFPLPNVTQVNLCLAAMNSFKAMVDECMKLTGAAGCNCWVNSTFAPLAVTIRSNECKVSSVAKAVVKQLSYCKANFSLCKTYEDEGLKAISACSQSTASLLGKAKALTDNSAGLTAAKATASSLTSTNSTNSSGRATASSCASVVTTITTLITLTDQNPASTQISTLCKSVTNVTVTCTSVEKASLTTQVTSLDASISSVSEELATVQEDLATATGTTASSSSIANTTATAASTGRRNIVARHLMNRLNLN